MYSYEIEKQKLFTEDGQVLFLKIRDKVHALLLTSGAVQMHNATAGNTGNTWEFMACVDRLVELGEIKELERQCPAQYRTFVLKGH